MFSDDSSVAEDNLSLADPLTGEFSRRPDYYKRPNPDILTEFDARIDHRCGMNKGSHC